MARKRIPLSPPADTALPNVNDAAAEHVDPEHSAPFLIACIGASAGGIDATAALLGELDSQTGVAFVVVQHLDPVHKSMLGEILGRATSMQVSIAADGMPVEPDCVYVIPPGKNMVIGDGRLQLAPRTEVRGQHRPIDHFLRSLAEEHGHKAIGVILSGMGNDGALGMEEIKAGGGITFAQDNSAEQSSMPRHAAATGCVDQVLAPAAIAAEINRIAQHPLVRRVPPMDSDGQSREAFDRIIEILRETSDVDFSNYKRNTLHRRITRRMVLHKLESLDQYAEFLTATPAEADALYQDVLINVTSFFRDPQAYEALKEHVFPELSTERTRHEPVRVWALGCSTGEEAYSIAMAYTEFAEAHGKRVPMQVFATDLNSAGIERARAGLYPKSIEQDVDPERLRRFFIEIDGSYRICKPIRDMCIFARQNVLADPPFSRIDLVACRNVLIYLEPVLQKRLIPMLHFALRGQGFLWLGMSETIGSYGDLFDMQDARHKTYRKKEGPPHVRAAVRVASREIGAPSQRPMAQRAVPAWSEALREVDRVLAARFSPPGVVVGADLDIVQFRGDTTPYLALLPGRPNLHLVKMARNGLGMVLRRAIEHARRDKVPVREEAIRVQSGDGYREIAIEVIPLKDERSEGSVVVLFDESGSVQPLPGSGGRAIEAGVPAGDDEVARENLRLRQELASMKDYLQSLIEQHEASNEELQSANEEVQSANEELQSINEELETSKEEIQSSNEELATVNDELQNRNLDLSQSNNDLLNLLASVNMAIVMLGPDLRIRRLTPAAERVLNLIPTDVGRPIRDIKLPIDVPDLESLLFDVVETVSVREREVRDGAGRLYLLRARAYRTIENRIDGAVLMLIDIDLHKRTEQALKETELRFTLLADTAPVLIWVMDLKETREINRAYREYVGVTASTLSQDNWTAFIHPEDREAYIELYRSANREPFETQFRLRRSDGLYRWMKSVAAPRTLGNGEFLGYVGCSFDIEDLKAAEAALRETDVAKTRFLAVLAHEFRTPLAAVSNAVQVLALASPDSDRYRNAGTILARQTANMARLLDDLVDLSRVTHGLVRLQRTRIDLMECLRHAIEVSSQELTAQQVRFAISGPDDPVWLDADPLRLDQLFTNLLTNAIKFSPAGGTVRVEVSRESEVREPARQPRSSNWPEVAVVRISDEGIGLAGSMLERVFEPFVQVDAQRPNVRPGMGLGLALARQLTELHEGSIRATSPGLGQGSTFVVRLPVRPAATPAQHSLVTADGASRPVLVVDDNPDAAEALRLMLELAAFEVETATDGRSALAAARARPPDIILLDINMPDMSGWEVARELRRDPRFVHTLIIALSGLGMPEDRQRSHEAGVDHHFTKPVSLQSLLGAIEDWQHGVVTPDLNETRD